MKKMNIFGISSAALLLAGLLPAQSLLVSPPRSANLGGYTYYSIPFARRDYTGTNPTYRQARLLQVHDNLSKTPLPIKGLVFRRGARDESDWPGWKVQVELTLSTAAVTSTTMSRTFAANHGKDATVVVAKKWIQFPPSLFLGRFVYPFIYKIPFDQGKVFLLGAGKSLAWDAKVFDNDLSKKPAFGGGFDMEYAYLRNYAYGSYIRWGRGTNVPGQNFSFYSYFTSRYDNRYPGKEIVLYGSCYYGPPSGQAFVLFARKEMPSGIPISGNGSLLYLNPGTIFYVSPPRGLDGRGYAYWSSSTTSTTTPPLLTLPDNPLLYGIHFSAQVFALDKSLTSIYASNMVRLQMVYPWQKAGPFKIAQIYAYNNANAPTGNPGFNTSYRRAMITGFLY